MWKYGGAYEQCGILALLGIQAIWPVALGSCLTIWSLAVWRWSMTMVWRWREHWTSEASLVELWDGRSLFAARCGAGCGIAWYENVERPSSGHLMLMLAYEDVFQWLHWPLGHKKGKL